MGKSIDSTEKEKMIAGEPYCAFDPELVSDRERAKGLCYHYNHTEPVAKERRRKILAELLGSIGQIALFEPPFICDYGYNISVGERFFANHGCTILDCAPVVIGDDVLLAPNVGIYTATHPTDPEQRRAGVEYALPITIGNGVWIGADVTILPGVIIGNNSTIGAGSVVVHDIPANVVAVGNPCRVVKRL